MKASLWIFCLAGILIAPVIKLQAASTNAVVLTLELQDGSRVIGKSDAGNFRFHSQILGDMKLAPAQISSVEFLSRTNWVRLVTSDGDTFSVEMKTKDIAMETSFGKISVPAKSIRRLTVSGTPVAGRAKGGLVALWSGEGNGNDAVGNNPATPVGPLGYSEGKRGRGFFFGGNNAYLLVHPNEDLDVGKGDGFTFEGWINPATVSADMIIFEFEKELGTANGSDVGMELAIHRTTPGGWGVGCLYANIIDAESMSHILTSPPNLLKPDVWQHVALTYDKNTGAETIYLNGSPIARANAGIFTPQTSFPNLLLGAKTTYNSEANPGNLYVGRLDEFGIYNRALSAAEIQAIYLEENGDAASN